MVAKQLSIFLENKSGRLTEVTEVLAKENINLSALCIAENADFGILRGIVSDPDRAYKACLLYTSDAADDQLCVDLGGPRIIKKKNYKVVVAATYVNEKPYTETVALHRAHHHIHIHI